jgi:hypothetical protein
LRSSHPPPAELILDFDATDNPIHGDQQARFFHGYYDNYCYLPLYVFCGEKLLVSYLRPANIDAAKHSPAILKLLTDRLRKQWPGVKIIFCGDSGFCRWRLMRWCDRHRVDYVIGLARNKTLEKRAEPFMQLAQQQYEQTKHKQRIFTDFDYAAGTWNRQRRVIHKAEHKGHGDNPRFVVTSLKDEAQRLYDDIYCARGEMENRLKEQQLGLFAGRTSCHAFVANQFRLLLSSFAYTLIQTLRCTALAGTELACAQASTIRVKLLRASKITSRDMLLVSSDRALRCAGLPVFSCNTAAPARLDPDPMLLRIISREVILEALKIGAIVTTSVRRIVLQLSCAYPLKELFATVVNRLTRSAVRLA